ncbi:MAG: hypothetical protein H6714_05600 [Myxococcales bacterium]|nr:hypothetical protein [Myxococcales bacterium]
MKILRISAIVLSLIGIAACGGSNYTLRGTSKVLATKGSLAIEEMEGGNNMLTAKLQHLPEPSRLGAGVTSYVAWILPAYGDPINAGTLAFDADTREAEVMATTPHDNFVFKITAESDARVTTPGTIVIVEQRVSVD